MHRDGNSLCKQNKIIKPASVNCSGASPRAGIRPQPAAGRCRLCRGPVVFSSTSLRFFLTLGTLHGIKIMGEASGNGV